MDTLKYLLSFLDERGEVGDPEQNPPQDPDPEPSHEPEPSGEQDPNKGEAQSFINPHELPEEIKPHWTRMHRAYTKALEKIKGVQENAQMVERFNTDPNFAMQVIQQRAKDMGFQLTKAQAQQMADNVASGVDQSEKTRIANILKARLDPQYHDWADQIAEMQVVAAQASAAGVQKKLEEDKLSRRNEDYTAMQEELSSKYPGWEEYEDEMLGLYNFLKSDNLKHRVYGSKLEILYNLASGNASAIQEVTDRFNKAARSKTSTGLTRPQTIPNTAEKILKAPNDRKAFDLAAELAMAELEKSGHKFS